MIAGIHKNTAKKTKQPLLNRKMEVHFIEKKKLK